MFGNRFTVEELKNKIAIKDALIESQRRRIVRADRDYAELQMNKITVDMFKQVESERDMFERFHTENRSSIAYLKDFISNQATMIDRLINE